MRSCCAVLEKIGWICYYISNRQLFISGGDIYGRKHET